MVCLDVAQVPIGASRILDVVAQVHIRASDMLTERSERRTDVEEPTQRKYIRNFGVDVCLPFSCHKSS